MRILFSSTSYPRSAEDWQGAFVEKIVSQLALKHQLTLLSPYGPKPGGVNWSPELSSLELLSKLANQGGISHLLRNHPLKAAYFIPQMLHRQAQAYRHQAQFDLLHINWLQNAIACPSGSTPLLLTVLGTDYKMLKIPGVANLVRRTIKGRRCIIAPNASWMEPLLNEKFGDIAQIRTVNFGVEQQLYQQHTPRSAQKWLVIQRITTAKMGPLFEWSKDLSPEQRIHLIGPNQENLTIPSHLISEGATDSKTIRDYWLPQAKGLITLSQHDEGLPQILIEAAAFGTPIIASDLAAHREIVTHGENGYIVSDKEAFIASLDRCVDPETNSILGENSQRIAKAKFGSWVDCANRYNRLYEELLA